MPIISSDGSLAWVAGIRARLCSLVLALSTAALVLVFEWPFFRMKTNKNLSARSAGAESEGEDGIQRNARLTGYGGGDGDGDG